MEPGAAGRRNDPEGDIALGLLADVFASLGALIESAEARPASERDDVVINGIVELLVAQRQVMSTPYSDPDLERLVSED